MVELSALSHALAESNIPFRTVRVIASSSGAFVQSALLEGGAEQGIKVGLPVINASGVLGRIVDAGRTTARLLLLTDISSKVPVFIGQRQVRAILAGDNRAHPSLVYLPPDLTVADGAEITTSGMGGVFPRGLRVGRVRRIGAALRADLYAALGSSEYVSVLLYDNPGSVLAAELKSMRASDRRSVVGVK